MQYLERSCLLLVTAASDLLVRTIRFRSVVFGVTSNLGRSCTVETRRRSLVITRGAWWSNTRIPAINEKPATSAIYKPRCSIDRKARYSLRIGILAYHACIRGPRYGGFPSKYCHAVWYGKKLE